MGLVKTDFFHLKQYPKNMSSQHTSPDQQTPHWTQLPMPVLPPIEIAKQYMASFAMKDGQYLPLRHHMWRIYEIACNVYPNLPNTCKIDIALQIIKHCELHDMMETIYDEKRWRRYFRPLNIGHLFFPSKQTVFILDN